jgi:hypothetical protein
MVRLLLGINAQPSTCRVASRRNALTGSRLAFVSTRFGHKIRRQRNRGQRAGIGVHITYPKVFPCPGCGPEMGES